MNKMLTILVVLLVLLVGLAFVKDTVIKNGIEKGVDIVTGLKLSIKSLNVGILKTVVGIKELKLHNPAGFTDPVMLDMPEIFVSYDLPAIFGGKVHLKEMRIDMKEFVVEKNAGGKLNLDSLRPVKSQKAKEAPEKSTGGKAPEVMIDDLKLKIGKVVYKDYSKGGAPQVSEFNINLNEEYKNIDDPYSLISLIVVKALMNTSIAGLANFDLAGLKGSIGPELATAQKLVGESVMKAQETLKTAASTVKNVQAQAAQAKASLAQSTQAAQTTVKQTEENLKKTADSLKNAFSNPFGGTENKQ